jgi:molecular chaperone Hsp33
VALPPDSIVRAVTRDQAFRVLVARTTQTVQGAMSAQQGTGRAGRYFGDLLTATVLFRQTMAPTLRVQGILRGADGKSAMVADSHPSGATRGLVQPAGNDGDFDLGEGALLQMMRTLQDGRINQGVVAVGQPPSISQALMSYMQTSEQTVTMTAVGTLLEGGTVTAAGGYLLQLLPDAPRGALMIMTERLHDYRSVDPQLAHPEFSPSWLLSELLHGVPYDQTAEEALRYECWCDELRVVAALATLDRAELTELLSAGKVLEISCDYCGREFQIPPGRLKGLLNDS